MSRPTVANYLAVLETTKVAVVIRPFSTRRASEIVHAPKVYGFDTGFVRILRGWGELREEDLGSLWEHYVLGEILAVGPAAGPVLADGPAPGGGPRRGSGRGGPDRGRVQVAG